MAKAAYRSGEVLFDERTGQFFDYGAGEHRVIDKWIMTRRGVAEPGREAMWNAAEAAEPRKNGRLATEFEIGLPHELTDAQRRDLLKNFLAPIIARTGVAADVAIHTADDWRNVHAHILLTHREYGPDGFGEIANRRTTTKKVKGQEKQIEIAGIAATPADIKFLREQWANAVNRAYEKAGWNIRVDHRSFEDRGIKDVPTIHLGPKATAMERSGKPSDRGEINREITRHNAELRRLEAEKERQDAAIIDLAAKLAERLAHQAAGRRDQTTPRKAKEMDEQTPQETDSPSSSRSSGISSTTPANQNQREPQPAQIGLSVPPGFGPETLAATSPGEADRIVETMREQNAPPFDEQRKTFRPTTNPEPGRYDELKQPTPEPELTAPEAVAAAKADNFRLLEPDEARETLEAWAAAQEPSANQNNPERIATVSETPPIGAEARQTPEAAPASTAPGEANTPTGEAPRAAQTEIPEVKTAEALRADLDAPEGRRGFENFMSAAEDFLGAAFEGIGERLGSFISYLSDFIAPPPPLTRAQAETAAKVAAEQAEEEARAAAYRGYVPGYDPPAAAPGTDRRNDLGADRRREPGREDDLEPD
jgi:MobA/MobL family